MTGNEDVTAKSEAGGGTSRAMDPHAADIVAFETNILAALKHYHDAVTNGKEKLAAEQSDDFSDHDLSKFLKYMASTRSNALMLPPPTDLSLPLSSYFISSSHNTYLTGHQLYGTSTTEGYKNVLLRGCRCVEIDCWNGDGDDHDDKKINKDSELHRTTTASSTSAKSSEPVVTHGHTATKDITFRSVCESIRDYAFTSTDLPLIVSLEVHTNHAQQELMVQIMHDCFKDHLAQGLNEEDWGADTKLPTPGQMKNKILIKVKYSPPRSAAAEQSEAVPVHRVETTSSSEDEAKPKVNKIVDSLSRLGLYTRSFHFSNLSQPEAQVPTHIFSLSETSLIGLYKDDPEGLFNHNKCYLMRAYPKGLRISSSNLDPSHFWRAGVQMVALNWQKMDKGMMLQEAMFQATGGWAKKPESFMSDATYRDSREHFVHGGRSWLRLTILAAQNIPLPYDVESDEKLKPYIKCEIHVDTPDLGKSTSVSKGFGKDGASRYKQKTSSAKGRHPAFDQHKPLDFKHLPPLVPELSFLRLKIIHDERFGRDDVAAWACIRLDRLAPGLRFIHLWDAHGLPSQGVLLAKIEYQWNI